MIRNDVMRTKKIFAWVASLALCFSMLTACGSVEEKTQTTDPAPAAAEQKELKAEETTQTTAPAAAANEQNDFQNDEINKLFDNNYDYEDEMVQGSESKIVFIDMNGKTGSVDLISDRDCTLIAAAYEEDGVKMLDSVTAEISAGSTNTSFKFTNELPEFYYLRAFLVDKTDLKPLARAYEKSVYNIDEDKYYKENATLYEIKDAVPEEMFSEAEAIEFLTQKGFTGQPVTYDYTVDCKCIDNCEASADSSDKHPMYQTYFVSEAGEIWLITITGKTITATPISDDFYSTDSVPLIFAETDHLYCFVSNTKKYYIAAPLKSEGKLMIIDDVNAEALGKLTAEDINNS